MKITSLTIIIGLILFALGLGLGLMLVRVPGIPYHPLFFGQEPITAQEHKTRIVLGSAVLDSLCANVSGQVAEVGENIIIITRDQDRMELRVEQDAHISRLSPGVVPTREVIELGQIKEGEHADIYAVITEQGEIVAREITVQ